MDERGVVLDEGDRVDRLDRPGVGAAGHEGEQVEAVRAGLVGNRCLRALAVGECFGDRVLLEVDGVQAHERGRLAERLMDLVLLLEQALEDREVAADLVVVGLEQEGPDLGRVTLAVAVDPSVALIDADDAPRKIEVDRGDGRPCGGSRPRKRRHR